MEGIGFGGKERIPVAYSPDPTGSSDMSTFIIRPEVLRESGGRIRWRLPGNTDEQNLQIGIRNIQALFLERFPSFELFIEEGKVMEDKKDAAREFVVNNVGLLEDFLEVFGGSSIARGTAPYFGGTYRNVLIKSFNPLGIDLDEELLLKRTSDRRIHANTGYYVDEHGEQWVSKNYFRQKYGFNSERITEILANIPWISGIGNDRGFNLYNLTLAESIITPSLPQKESPENIIFHDGANGKKLINPKEQKKGLNQLKDYFTGKVGFASLEPFILTKFYRTRTNGNRYAVGFTDGGITRTIFLTDELNKRIKDGVTFLIIPRQDKKKRYQWVDFYEVENGAVHADEIVSFYKVNENGTITTREWPGFPKQIFLDFIAANKDIEVDELQDFTSFVRKNRCAQFGTINGVPIRAQTTHPLWKEGAKITFRPQKTSEDESITLMGYTFNENGEEVLVYTKTYYKNHLAKYKVKYRERQEIEIQRDTLEKEIISFFQEIAQNNTVAAHDIKTLISLFGASRAIDILYRYRPDFAGLPVEYVRSTLSEYLGDFLVTRIPFVRDNLGETIEYLSDPNLREGLLEVIKENCLTHYYAQRKQGNTESDAEIIREYFDIVGMLVDSHNSLLLDQVVADARKYYEEVLYQFEKPDHIITALREGRRFPDLNQLINIKEISDKKRMLIADEMGLGKSASVILAKEYLKLGTAIVVAPANVLGAWKEYLQDEQNGGYFKSGKAPRVLMVDDPEILKSIDNFTYDYILISQERLNNNYTPYIFRINYDMLIVDESHKLKNLTEGIRTEHLLQLAAKIEGEEKYLALLSGTPVPNKIEDLAMILKLLHPEKFSTMDNRVLVRSIIKGDLIDLRTLLLPRMQMKSLSESISMPELREKIEEISLSKIEREIYDVLMEEDELDAKEKMRVLRQFLLNPDFVDPTPGVPSAKTETLGQSLTEKFTQKDKIVLFVNGYIENVIRGDTTIFKRLSLPEGVEVRIIDGEIPPAQRTAIRKELEEPGKKILLVVSGQTADVGVDFSAANSVDFYNEPWTMFDKRQQMHRVYREGVQGTVDSDTYITKDTIEEGIHEYIQAKERAILKLLRGIPISELEQQLLEKNEEQIDPNLEVNAELADYYFSSWDKLLHIFSQVREIGEKNFRAFIAKHGHEYAGCYLDLGSRSYQANASRVSAALLDHFIVSAGQQAKDIRLLDVASGPEMLRLHSKEVYQDRIFSVDINEHHFQQEGDKRTVGSFLALPYQPNSFDYLNMSLAWHYTNFAPSRGLNERLEVFAEANRVLKIGGKMVLNNIYSLDVKDPEKFRKLMKRFGFNVIEHYSGNVSVNNNYGSHVYTLEKQEDIAIPFEELLESIDRSGFDGVRFIQTNMRPKDTKKLLRSFSLQGEEYTIPLNVQDQIILQEEKDISDLGNSLKKQFGSIENIPKEDVLKNNFVRILIGKKYVLFKKMQIGNGVIVIK